MNGRRPELGRLESAALAVVAASSEPLTVSQVQAQLPTDPAYTTVMSTLTRLARKGALRQIREAARTATNWPPRPRPSMTP